MREKIPVAGSFVGGEVEVKVPKSFAVEDVLGFQQKSGAITPISRIILA